MKNKYLLLLPFLCLLPEISGQDALQINRYIQPIEFDGRPFEDTWNDLDDIPLTMHQPNFGIEPSEKSEVMITYDDEFLWVGARLYMQDASEIIVSSKQRDELNLFYDSFTIILDTYNDNENALCFYTMPSGLRTDYTVANDAAMNAGGVPFNTGWNTFWDVKTTMDDRGWYAEMRIPFSSLKFKPEDDITEMGLIIRRIISSNNEIDTYPAIDNRYGQTANTKPSLGATIAFEGVQPSKPVYISPYAITGFSRNWVLNPEETGYVSDDTPDLNAGLDIKYNINSNLTLDLTANTDFAQVEADGQQVNLTRYSLFFPEKRMFFQERASLFNFSLGGFSSLFYSRRIGLSNGEPVRIYGGARLVGRAGKLDLGLIDMQTEAQGDLPGENFGVLRMRRQVINPYSYVGGMFTSRLGMNGDQNFAYGLDGIFRVFGDDYFDVKIAQTYDSKIGNQLDAIEPMFLSAKWERRSMKGFAYNLGYSYSGEEFNPGIGFNNKGGLQGFNGGLSYGWLPGPSSKIFSIAVSGNVERYARLADNELESMLTTLGFGIQSKTGYGADFSLNIQQEGVLFNFPITGELMVNAGEYAFTHASVNLETPTSRAFYSTMNLSGGEFYDGQRYGLSLSSSWSVSPSLQLTGSYEYNHILFPVRDLVEGIHLASGKVLFMLNTKLSASLYMQYSSVDDLITNFRVRFNPREGNDLYLVFNESRNVSNIQVTPELPGYDNRTILLKYTHTFRL